jgi:mannose-6-phosphate isomerase-like protein (cupin superfamily)
VRRNGIFHAPGKAEYFFREGCYIGEWWNDPADPELSVSRARVKPGVSTRLHRLHGVTERYLVLEGRGRVEVEGLAPTEVGPGDVVLITPETAQRITNTGQIDLVFLAVCTPRFRPEVYHEAPSEDDPA